MRLINNLMLPLLSPYFVNFIWRFSQLLSSSTPWLFKQKQRNKEQFFVVLLPSLRSGFISFLLSSSSYGNGGGGLDADHGGRAGGQVLQRARQVVDIGQAVAHKEHVHGRHRVGHGQRRQRRHCAQQRPHVHYKKWPSVYTKN